MVNQLLMQIRKWWCNFQLKIGVNRLSLLLVAWLVLFYNDPLWHQLLQVNSGLWSKVLFLGSFFLLLLAFFHAFVVLFGFRYIFKPVVVSLLLSASLASYFMSEYGVVIDSAMIQNVMETDVVESFELFNGKALFHFLTWGVLPALLVWRIDIEHRPFFKGLLNKAVVFSLSMGVAGVSIYAFYDEYASIARNNRQLRHLITPTNYLYSFSSYLMGSAQAGPVVIQRIGEDAHKLPDVASNGKKNLVILVVGETARAENFSLNGYGRNTNPRLSQEAIINFGHVSSCGTATAVSVPCMFSNLGHDNYSDSVAKGQEGVLDVVARSGIPVLWRDNNSGCKGACDRVASEQLSDLKVEPYCDSEQCFDLILLHKLDDYLAQLKGDGLIVLHQKGSHGPTYFHRYPEEFQQFTPICATSELHNCSHEEIVNAYDNTILYTDYFLSRVIAYLKEHSDRFNGAMFYISDHGESLGENNVYLHGLPYLIAPEQQTHVPMITWFAPEFQQVKGMDGACLARLKDGTYSHDNLFHTMLGLMGVASKVYDAKLDIFASCEPRR